MNSTNLQKLQEKVSRLIQCSSDDDSSSNRIDLEMGNGSSAKKTDINVETERKCLDLVEKNRMLRRQLEEVRKQKQLLINQIQYIKQSANNNRQEGKEQEPQRSNPRKPYPNEYKIHKNAKLKYELEEMQKKCRQLEGALSNQRKKYHQLCLFFSRKVPFMEKTMDRLESKLNSKLEKYFCSIRDI